jgi:hypothetical protein
MTQASQPETDSNTGKMVLGVQCACQVVPWKDRGYSIEPCSLHAVADDLLEALEEIARREGAYSRDPLTHAENTIDNMERIARDAIAKAQP